MLSESTGSALVALSMSNTFTVDPQKAVPTFSSAIPGLYMLHTFSTGAIVMRWFRDEFCELEKQEELSSGINAYTSIDELVKKVPCGCDGLIMLPYLQGSGAPDLNENATGTIHGITASTTKAHFARAIMEGIALVLRRMVEGTENLGIPVEAILSLGGGARSDVWCQIKADVTGKMVKVVADSEYAPSLGSVILAGSAGGIWPSVEAAVDELIHFDKIYNPNPEARHIYEGLYQQFQDLQNRLSIV